MTESISLLLKTILEGIAYKKVDVSFEWTSTRVLKFTAGVQASDMGFVMGKKARIIQSIQYICKRIADHYRLGGITVNLESEPDQKLIAGPRAKAGWKDDLCLDLVSSILNETGCQIINLHLVPVSTRCTGIVINPDPEDPLFGAIHNVVEAYGRTWEKCIGLYRK